MLEKTQDPEPRWPGEPEKIAIMAHSGGLTVRLAESSDEIEAAQKLRYKVFYEEKKATPTDEVVRAGRDVDGFDALADHLLVIDTTKTGADRAVVGTYRLMRREAAQKGGGFYSRSEFDIARLNEWPGEVLELGRSCVDEAYRNRRVINLLWRGIALYLKQYDIQLMFGCGSLAGTDPEALRAPLSYLYHHHLAPRHIRPRALPERYVKMDMTPKDELDAAMALEEIPPLIKGYLRLGGFVGDGAVIDEQFNCTDVCVVVKTDLMTAKYAKYYGCEVQSLNAA